MEVIGSVFESLWWFGGYILPFLFVLAIVIFFHELGHFLVGRWCGVGVKAFSLGFGPELVGFDDRHGTRWKLCAVPLGGYVKFEGDANGASVPDHAAISAMSSEEKARSFMGAAVWRRAAIVAAGPVANFLLAIAIFAATFFVYGREVHEPVVTGVQPGSAAETAGIRTGDRIVSIDGTAVFSFEDVQRIVSTNAERPLAMVLEREGAPVTLVATPQKREVKTRLGVQRTGVLGLLRGQSTELNTRMETYSPLHSLELGVAETWFIIQQTSSYLGKVISGRESADQIGGAPRIAQVSGEVARHGLVALLNLAAVLSVSIGLINLFPMPPLDGGHLVMYAYEAIRGRPMRESVQEMGFKVGFALVLMLMLFATSNDVLHFWSLMRSPT